MQKKILLGLVGVIVIIFFAFDFHLLLTLDSIKGQLESFHAHREESPVLMSLVYFLVYVAVAALSLPGAAILTLLGGGLFGLVWGFFLVSFASTIGASLAFLISRYFLRETVQKRFGQRLKPINDGVEREGAFYLFAMRLVPGFPFFVINILMALTKMRLTTFYWVSQVGMIAGTLVYVNAGRQLATIESLGDIASPGILISFSLLGLFPVIAKKVLDQIKAKKVYENWVKPESFDRNLVVIGAGAGGLVSSYIAAATKAKVTLVETHKMGGDCLNYGCVPSKAIIKSAKVANAVRKGQAFGLNVQAPKVDFKAVMKRVHDVIAQIEPHDSVERYTNLGVDVVQGYATLIDPWTVEIKRSDETVQRLTAKSIILATGAAPFVPPLPGIDAANMVTSDTLWDTFAKLDEIPRRLLVLGGGPIGCELAQSFARLGSQVIQVEMGDRLMAREDEDVSDVVKQQLESDGVQVLTNHTAVRFEQHQGEQGTELHLIVTHNGEEKTIEYDCVLCAVGRAARLTGFGLERLGIESTRTLTTNEFLQTKYPNIYGVGDLVGPYQLTHAAAHQAWFAAVNGLFGSGLKKFKVDYRVLPWCTFVDPEVARVGLNEQEAKAQNTPYEVTQYDLDDLDRAIAEGETKGFVKVLTVPKSDKILGVTIVGAHAGDLIAEFVLAMKKGIGLNAILGTVHSYPTWAEANKYAAGMWKKKNAPEALLKYVEKFHAWRRGA